MFEDIQRCAIAAVNLVYACHSKQPVSEGLQSLEFSHLHFVPCFSRAASTLEGNTVFRKYLSEWKKSRSSGPKSALDNANDIIKDFNSTVARGQTLAKLIQPLIDLLSALQTLLHSESSFIQNAGKLKGDSSVNGILAKYNFSVKSYTQRESLISMLNNTIRRLKNYQIDSSEINVKCFLDAFSHLQAWPRNVIPNERKISKLASEIHGKPVSARRDETKLTSDVKRLSSYDHKVSTLLGKRSPISVTAPVSEVSPSNPEIKSSQNVTPNHVR